MRRVIERKNARSELKLIGRARAFTCRADDGSTYKMQLEGKSPSCRMVTKCPAWQCPTRLLRLFTARLVALGVAWRSQGEGWQV